jgi:hypothetical protein
LGERGREAPKSLRVLELIEASANIGRNELGLARVCVESAEFCHVGKKPASSFYRLKEGRSTYMGRSLISSSSPRIGGSSG